MRARMAGPFTPMPSMIHLSHQLESVATKPVSHPAPLTRPSIDVGIEPGTGFAEAQHAEAHVTELAAAGEGVIVALVHVILVVETCCRRAATAARSARCSPCRRGDSASSHAPANQCRAPPREHQQVFGAAGVLFFLFSGGQLCRLLPSALKDCASPAKTGSRNFANDRSLQGCAASPAIRRRSRQNARIDQRHRHRLRAIRGCGARLRGSCAGWPWKVRYIRRNM